MKEEIILDVRTPEECKAQRVSNSVEIPLSSMKEKEEYIAKILKWKSVTLLCRNWNRAAIAKSMLTSFFENEIDLKVYDWWVVQYQKDFPDQVIAGWVWCNIAIVQQVQIIVWVLITLFCILWYFVHPLFFIWAVLAGLWTIYTGVTWVCYTARLLAKFKFNTNNTYK